MAQKVSLDLGGGGAWAKASHHCDQLSRFDLPIALTVIQGETFLKVWKELPQSWLSKAFLIMAKMNSITVKQLSHISYWSVSIYQYINNGDSKVAELWSSTLLHASNMSPLKLCSIPKAQRSCAAGSSANMLTLNISPVIWSWDRNFAWNEQKIEEFLQAEFDKDQESESSHHRGCGCDLSCSGRETDPGCKMRNAGHYDTRGVGGWEGPAGSHVSTNTPSASFRLQSTFLYLQNYLYTFKWSTSSSCGPWPHLRVPVWEDIKFEILQRCMKSSAAALMQNKTCVHKSDFNFYPAAMGTARCSAISPTGVWLQVRLFITCTTRLIVKYTLTDVDKKIMELYLCSVTTARMWRRPGTSEEHTGGTHEEEQSGPLCNLLKSVWFSKWCEYCGSVPASKTQHTNILRTLFTIMFFSWQVISEILL